METGDGMRPQPGQTELVIPISWEVKRQEKKNWTTIVTLAIVIAVILIVATIGVLFGNYNFIMKLVLVVAGWGGYIYIYRFMVFKENIVRRQYEEMSAQDNKVPVKQYWQIFSIDNNAPHIAHFMNGYKAVYLKVHKDVIQGKQDNIEFDHYEKVALAYAKAAELKLKIEYIDYMDNVGNDERLEKLFENTNIQGNPDLSNFLMTIYSNLQYLMQQEFSSFDVYVLYARTSSEDMARGTAQFIDELKDANYKSVTPMNKEEIRLLAKELFNLENFSVVNASREVVDSNKINIIRPIKLIHHDGREDKLNDTFEEEDEKRQERREKPKEKKRSRRQKEQDDEVHLDSDGVISKPAELIDMFEQEQLDSSDEDDNEESDNSTHTSIVDFSSLLKDSTVELKRDQDSDKAKGIVDIFDVDDNTDGKNSDDTVKPKVSEDKYPNKSKPERTSRGTFKVSDTKTDPYQDNLDIFGNDKEDSDSVGPGGTDFDESNNSSHSEEDENIDIF